MNRISMSYHFLNFRIQSLLNLALIYISDAFIYTSEMFIQVSVLSNRLFCLRLYKSQTSVFKSSGLETS